MNYIVNVIIKENQWKLVMILDKWSNLIFSYFRDFPYEIKSLKIPFGTTLTIYDHPNYEGERHTFSKNEECLENVIVLT